MPSCSVDPPLDHDMSEASENIVVARFHFRHDGEIARGFLEDADIPAALFIDDAGGAEPNLAFVSPARLVVRAEDAERAKEILWNAGYDTVESG
jgi:hypothetical protein